VGTAGALKLDPEEEVGKLCCPLYTTFSFEEAR
jgi:hypothetical protein